MPAHAAYALAATVSPGSTDLSFDYVAAGPGETEFFRMPARLFHGREFLVAV